jgi:phage terminase large subunit-like protein
VALTPDELARLSPADQARYLALRQAQFGGLPFAEFVRARAPDIAARGTPRHLRQLYSLFELSRHRPVWATVSMPPRHGKTTTLRMYLAWRLLRDPACLNFYVTFGDSLATDFSYKARKLARAAGVPLASDRQNVHDWATTFDGGLKATSVGGEITGRGCNGGAIGMDDLIKGRIAAESRLIRDKTMEYVLDDVTTRRERGASAFLFGTRWHPDDPIGRVLKDGYGEDWTHIKLAAVVHKLTREPIDGGVRGQDFDPELHEALWPEAGYDLEWARKERAKGAYRWWSLYQQEPRPREGRMFEEPARLVEGATLLDGGGWRLIFALDPAATAKETSDYWAGGILAMRGAGDATEARPIARFRLQARIDAVLRMVRKVREKYPLPVWLEGVGAFALVPDAVRMADRTLPLKLIPGKMVRGDKKTRATGLSACWNDPRGRFAVPLGTDGCFDDESWDDYIEEFREFTGLDDPHDDQVDWTAHAFNLGYRQANTGGGQSTLEVPLPE